MATAEKYTTEATLYKKIYSEVFRRIGIQFDLKYYPPKRSSYLTDSEEVDGDVWRVYDYNDLHPNLVRVEEPTFFLNFTAFTTDPTLKLEGWESLRGTNYRVEYVRGGKKAKEKLTEVVAKENLSMANALSIALGKLEAGRTDIFVYPEPEVLLMMKENKHIYKAGVMETITVHAFLIKKHQMLAPHISSVLKEMKREGLLETYKSIVESGSTQ